MFATSNYKMFSSCPLLLTLSFMMALHIFIPANGPDQYRVPSFTTKKRTDVHKGCRSSKYYYIVCQMYASGI